MLDKITLTRSGVMALLVTLVFITGITIIGDLVSTIKPWLAATFGHHWVGKGVLSVLLFALMTAVSYPVFKRDQAGISVRAIRVAAHFAIAGTLLMTLFFVYEYLKH